MINSFLRPAIVICMLIFIGCSSTKAPGSKNEAIVKRYIKARNNYDIEQLSSLIDEDYNETFVDGSKEIENKNQLIDRVLWGKELDSQIKLLNVISNGNTVITIEENTNYLDVALKRKSRQFKIVYSLDNNRIFHQKIDTLSGYKQISKFNSDRYKEFASYCDENHLRYRHDSLNQEFGIHLRKVLETYKTANK